MIMKRGGLVARSIRADRPFLFVIQHHGAGGAALFIGRVSDPTAG